jgi:lipid A 3-O-deacylase
LPARPLLAALALVAATGAAAGELVLGLGADDALQWRDGAVGLAVEYRFDPRWTLGPAALGFGIAGEADTDEDFWLGGGVVLTAPITGRWRVQASVMPGVYGHGIGHDLGASAPMFRSQLGASAEIAPGWRLGVALNHKSNAGTAEENPGVETLLVTLGRSF